MNKVKTYLKNKKILLLSLLLILFIGVSFAYVIAQLSGGATGNVNISADTTDNLKFSVDKEIDLNPTQFSVTEGGSGLSDQATGTASLVANSTNKTATFNYYVYFQINSNNYVYTTPEKTPEIVLTITNPLGEEITSLSGLNYVTATNADGTQVKGFDITTANDLYNVASLYEISSSSSTNPTIQNWTFKVTFINLETNQHENGGKSLNASILLKKDEYKTFASYIINEVYTADGENGLYYHDGVGTYTNADQEAGDNSYRYSGANPNNYVCFGSDADTCPDEYLYRIIGVFDEDGDGEYNVKLIKADYTTSAMLGTDGRDYYGSYDGHTSYYKGSIDTSEVAAYRWNYDTSVSSMGSNNWVTSELNKINLNTNYLNYLESSWNSMIEDSTWHLGGITSNDNTSKSFYTGERNNAGYGSNPTTYGPENANGNSTKIGLMYVSDYGYAAYSDAWTTNLSSYGSSAITQNNWLYMGLFEWILTTHSSNSYRVFMLHSGYLSYDSAYDGYSVRPVFYLKSNISYASGNGTKDSPFRIAV